MARGDMTDFVEELDCWESITDITFSDGTKIRVTYGKKLDGAELGIWNINVLEKGNAQSELVICEDENADIYSDIFYIEAEITKKTIKIKR